MSTNKTKNYQLHAWKPTDDFLLTEINQNFEKLDRLMPRIVMGSYIKSGSGDMVVDLGFRPKAVLVLESHLFTSDNAAYYSAMVIDGMPLWSQCPLSITNTGFRVFRDVSVSGRKGTNMKEYNYLYMAIR